MWLLAVLLVSLKGLGFPFFDIFKHLKRDLAIVVTTSSVLSTASTIALGDDAIGPRNADTLPSDEYMDDAVLSIKQHVEKDDIIVLINGQNTEGVSKDEVYNILKETNAPYSLVFRRPNKFYSLLDSSVNGDITSHINTVVAPATTNTKKQLLDVKRIFTGDSCARSAKRGDIIEITMTKDRDLGNDDVKGEFYVLGDQETDLPRGLQLGLYGMCPDEARSIVVPPSLLKTEDESNQIYNVKLISLSEGQ